MRSRRPGLRRGFTLLELIVVIGIILILATLAVLFLPNLDRNKGVPNAAMQVEGWIRLGKNHALRDGAPRGVRLLVEDPNSPDPRCVQLQYIEQPDPISPHGIAPTGQRIALVITSPNPNPNGPPPYPPDPNTPNLWSTAHLVLLDPTTKAPVTGLNWDDPLNPQVAPGDFLELTASPHHVAQIVAGPGPSPMFPGGQRAAFQIDRTIDGTDVTPLILTEGFRIIRSPRPLSGEPLLELHKDVYIDLKNCFPCPMQLHDASTGQPMNSGSPPYGNAVTYFSPWSLNGNIDILFNSAGVVANATTGQLIIAVRHVDRPNDALFVVVYTRTGKVTAVPVWDSSVPNDPYLFTRDGRSSGL